MSRHKKFSSIGKILTEDVNNGTLYRTNRKITSIAVHCTFSPQYRGDTVYIIDDWHKERFGSGIGYHFFIDEQGRIFKGRWLDYKGAHVKGHNKHSIGIVRIGGQDGNGHQRHDANSLQIKSIQKLTHLLIKQYDLPSISILGHNEYPNVKKSCPLLNMNLIRNIVG